MTVARRTNGLALCPHRLAPAIARELASRDGSARVCGQYAVLAKRASCATIGPSGSNITRSRPVSDAKVCLSSASAATVGLKFGDIEREIVGTDFEGVDRQRYRPDAPLTGSSTARASRPGDIDEVSDWRSSFRRCGASSRSGSAAPALPTVKTSGRSPLASR